MAPELTKTQQELRQEFEANRIQFILTELDTASTFCEVALASNNPEKTQRNAANGCTGYKTALRIAKKANLQGEAKEQFEHKVGRVRDLLRHLGQEV
jgi:hypothetical protein